MLKWFRKYNKFILVAGACLLMVAFLLPANMQKNMFGGADPVIGTIGDVEIMESDLRHASAELDLLQRLEGPMRFFQQMGVTDLDDPITYLLLVHEAKTMGLMPSEGAISSWMAAREMDSAFVERLKGALREIEPQHREAFIRGAFGNLIAIERAYPMVHGRPRVTAPMLDGMVWDSRARVKVAALKIPAQKFLDQVEVSEGDVKAHYEKHKDRFPGNATEDNPLGFGYKRKNRVKLEYIMVPWETVLEASRVGDDEIDKMLQYYEQHKDENLSWQIQDDPAEGPDGEQDGEVDDSDEAAKADEASQTPRYKPFREVKEDIRDTMTRERAVELGENVMRRVSAILDQDRVKLPEGPKEYGVQYLDVPEDFVPTPLDQVAAMVEEEYKDKGLARPTVVILNSKWLDAEALAGLENIGDSAMRREGTSPTPFVAYAMACRGLKQEDVESPVLEFALQEKLASMPLESRVRGFFGGMMFSPEPDRFIFRITQLQAEQPEPFEEIKSRVRADLELKRAYELLKSRKMELVEQATSDVLKIIDDLRLEQRAMIQPPAFPRREVTEAPFRNTGIMLLDVKVPEVNEAIGRRAQFVDAVFERFDELVVKDNWRDLSKQRWLGAPVDEDRALWIVRIEDMMLPTQSMFNIYKAGWYEIPQGQDAEEQGIRMKNSMQRSLYGVSERGNPYTREAIMARVGFKWEKDEEAKKQDEAED